jgi:Cys-tRNA(Pro) deacylase
MTEVVHPDTRVQRVVNAGRALGITVRPRVFPQHTKTAVDAARAIGCDVAQIVKSLVFVADGRPVLFLVSGANRVDIGFAAEAAGATHLDRADAKQARIATGYPIGATPPLGHESQLPVYIDRDLLTHDEVWAAAGRVDAVWPVNARALRDATNAIEVQVTSR